MIQSTTGYKYKYVVFTSVYGRKYNAYLKECLLFPPNYILVQSRSVIKSFSFGVKLYYFVVCWVVKISEVQVSVVLRIFDLQILATTKCVKLYQIFA